MHLRTTLLIAIALVSLQAQPKLEFEVATIKPSEGGPAQPGVPRRVGLMFAPGGGMNATGVSVKQLIGFAYDLPCGFGCDSMISGLPSWAESERFDIAAKGSDGDAGPVPGGPPPSPDQMRTTQEQMRAKMQSLLADRFQLKIRREAKEMPAYFLVAAKNGPKMKASESAGRPMMRMGRGQLNAQGVSVEMLARHLSATSGRTVIDKTGLKGDFDFVLEFTPEGPGPGGPGGPGGGPAPIADSPGPSLFTALQEQLGLRLESTKAPVDTIVVERLEKPTAN
jgi:bla regulator protein BlaR1